MRYLNANAGNSSEQLGIPARARSVILSRANGEGPLNRSEMFDNSAAGQRCCLDEVRSRSRSADVRSFAVSAAQDDTTFGRSGSENAPSVRGAIVIL